ncbi:hypothetical protein [Nocardiopsis sp. CC223A]|uniref:hypothetical protein n=1 Tax=Nocardiopsis sp. CC223A TaxID=3044051 RepID=UPI00278C8997|nr:hypothetical protein [Nocardiopsis sp. CC223A]
MSFAKQELVRLRKQFLELMAELTDVNPFSKVYDEVWTASRVGLDRYMRAQVGVRTDEIVEVGRPRLNSIRPDTAPNAVRTVLYAPTCFVPGGLLQQPDLLDR